MNIWTRGRIDRCSVCGRLLTDPKSVQQGIGPVCINKIMWGVEQGKDNRTLATLQFDPARGDIVCVRHGRIGAFGEELFETSCPIETNLHQAVVHHSPGGFEWGYGGSGPADFALNILNLFVPAGRDGLGKVKCFKGYCSAFAWRFHHDFKFEFIASLPKEGGVIPGTIIRAWIDARLPRFMEERGAGRPDVFTETGSKF